MASHWSGNSWIIRVPTLNHVELILQKEDLIEMLPSHFSGNRGVRDSLTWEWGLKRTFLVRSTYIKLNHRGIHFPFAKTIWKVKLPLKIRVFIVSYE